jgi:hypothetical protein
MKKILLYALPMLLLCSCLDKQEEDIEAKIKHFYTWYITVNHGKDGKTTSSDSLKKYCTEFFLTTVVNDTDLDYDPILSRDDKFNKEWVNTLMVTKATEKRDKIYRVSFLTDTKEMKSHNMVVTMGKEDGEWKIDYVKDNE